MNIFSTALVCACAGALIAGCSSGPYRSGKGSDHEVVYRPINASEPRVEREVVYVDRDRYIYQPVYQPAPVYYQPAPAPQPAYRVITANPNYTVVTARPTYRYVPVTRYYYTN